MDEQIAQLLSGEPPAVTPQQPVQFDYDSKSRNFQDHLSAAAKFARGQRLNEAEQAEKSGFDALFVPERHARTECMFPSTLTLGS